MFKSLFFGSFFQKRNGCFCGGYYINFSSFRESSLLGAENAESCNFVMSCFQGPESLKPLSPPAQSAR
jgi:hypothetical protein